MYQIIYIYTHVLIDVYVSIIEKVKNVSKKCLQQQQQKNGWMIIILRKRIQQFFKDLGGTPVCTSVPVALSYQYIMLCLLRCCVPAVFIRWRVDDRMKKKDKK